MSTRCVGFPPSPDLSFLGPVAPLLWKRVGRAAATRGNGRVGGKESWERLYAVGGAPERIFCEGEISSHKTGSIKPSHGKNIKLHKLLCQGVDAGSVRQAFSGLMVPTFRVWPALPIVILFCTLGLPHTGAQRRQQNIELINKAAKSLRTLSRGLCDGSTCSAEETCKEFNPCDSLFCPSKPDAVCLFCCCHSDIRWTLDGINLDECPVVKVLSVPDSIKDKVRLRANPSIPIPLIRFLDVVLPGATLQEGFSEDVLALKEASQNEGESQSSGAGSDCHNVLRRCKRTPWEPECRACQGNAGR